MKIVMLRGLLGGFPFRFSSGIDDLGKKLATRGYDVSITSWASRSLIKLKEKEVILIGHSLGANGAAWMPREHPNVNFPLIFLFDPTPDIQPIPTNVKAAFNYYQSNRSMFGRGTIKAENSNLTKISNFNTHQPHIVIPSLPAIHNDVIRKIHEYEKYRFISE